MHKGTGIETRAVSKKSLFPDYLFKDYYYLCHGTRQGVFGPEEPDKYGVPTGDDATTLAGADHDFPHLHLHLPSRRPISHPPMASAKLATLIIRASLLPCCIPPC